ncbi:hypothetical protein, partial [Gluconobacter japonicus]|uniref:hypothetical protein n=1 Tax=Gluconobacter japonicus TaxID=376620 RepID=UPI0024E11ACB
GKPLFNVKKSRLLHIAIPSVRTGRMESQSWFQNQRVFRTLHLGTHTTLLTFIGQHTDPQTVLLSHSAAKATE